MKPTIALPLAVLPVLVASLFGQLATFPNLAWYHSLAKPSFNPPNWVFGPVWTSLYALMAYAAWRLLRLEPATSGRSRAIVLFFLQLVLNAAWPWMFFAWHSPTAGLANIVVQWLSITGLLIQLRPIDRIATSCLLPLALWVAFALILNAAIWQLNADAP